MANEDELIAQYSAITGASATEVSLPLPKSVVNDLANPSSHANT